MELTKYKHLINLLLHNTALIQHPTLLALSNNRGEEKEQERNSSLGRNRGHLLGFYTEYGV